MGNDSIAGVRIGVEIELHILHGSYESIQTFVWIIQERPARNDQLPFAVPDRAPEQTRAGILGSLQFTSGPINNQRSKDCR